jgi:hypothetical protein
MTSPQRNKVMILAFFSDNLLVFEAKPVPVARASALRQFGLKQRQNALRLMLDNGNKFDYLLKDMRSASRA